MFESAGKEGARELNALAGLNRPKRDDDTFKLNLFGDRGGSGGGGGSGDAPTDDHGIVFGGHAGHTQPGLADGTKSFSLDEPKNAGAGAAQDEDDDDDLLALMDGA